MNFTKIFLKKVLYFVVVHMYYIELEIADTSNVGRTGTLRFGVLRSLLLQQQLSIN